jgi:hypothetical protein
MRLYVMDDRPDATSKAAVRVDEDEAFRLNNPTDCRGVFRTVNDFGDAPRRKEHLRSIRSWAIDIDDGSKAEMHAKLTRSPLVPSEIVETKRGYQAYWHAREAKAEHWNAIVLERLVPHFGADKNARDLCRILRAPGFLHLKDPADPFPVRTVWEHAVSYTERQIGEAFRWVPSKTEHAAQRAEANADLARSAPAGSTPGIEGEFWDAVWNLDGRAALERLSGSGYVNGETFTFRPTSRGGWNIFSDGKGTPCWVDANGKIGSPSGGGPTVAQWLKWYGHPWRYVVEALKTTFPHLAEIDARQREAWRAGRRAA